MGCSDTPPRYAAAASIRAPGTPNAGTRPRVARTLGPVHPDPLDLTEPLLLERLALGRSSVPKDALRRRSPGLLSELWHAPQTRVVLVAGPQLGVIDQDPGGEVGPQLALLTPGHVRRLAPQEEAELAYLGRDEEGEYLSWAPRSGTLPAGVAVGSLREVGHLFGDRDAGLATTAVALSQWRNGHRYCPRCGAPTELDEGGWAARCLRDGSSHYPRTDPAVIMAVHDGGGRLLLARSAAWPERRRSVLAGFVEAGEAPAEAVRREVMEEVGIPIGRVAYAGAQPWPFPASLMLGFHAWAIEAPPPRPDGEEITHADWFTRSQLAAAVERGEIGIPMRTSIARALIESWFGAELPD